MGGDLLSPASEAMLKVASVRQRGPPGSHLILPLLSVGIQGAKQDSPCSLTLLPINQIGVREPEAQPPNIQLGPLYCFHF